jgi:ribosomal protein S18 acetylase RimI-like enzyme
MSVTTKDAIWIRGFRTLTLVTGAANSGARSFYDRLGFLEEEVRLTKLLNTC